MTNCATTKIALFIDFENIGWKDDFDAGLLANKISKRGRLLIKRAYADWSRFSRARRQMLENAIELIELPDHNDRGKNAADIKMTVDALETAITKDYIDTVVIVSGDSDFGPLISKLREYNKYVIVIGHKRSASGLLDGCSDELIYYSSLQNEASDIHGAFHLLAQALQYLAEKDSEPQGGLVKNYMMQLDPEFDQAKYGYARFNLFLEKAAEEGIVVLKDGGHGNYLVALSGGGVRAENQQHHLTNGVVSPTLNGRSPSG